MAGASELEVALEVRLVVDMTGLAAAQAAQLLEASDNDVSLAVALFFGEEPMPAASGLAAEPSTPPNGGGGPAEDAGSDDGQPGAQPRRETPKTQRKARRAKGRRGSKDAAEEDDFFGSTSNYDQLSLMEAADEATLALESASSPVGRRRRQQHSDASAPIPITPPSSSSRRGRASRQERASNGEAAESELAGSAGRRGERLRGDGASGHSAPARGSGHSKQHRHSPLGSPPVPSPPGGVSVGSPLAATEPYPVPGSASSVDAQQQRRRRGSGGGSGLSGGEAAERVLSRVRWDPTFDEVRDELVVSWRKLAPCETRKSGEAAWSMRVQYAPCDTPFDEFMRCAARRVRRGGGGARRAGRAT
jgi:hypothetical protein